jgi:proline iminopeptidase
MWQADNDNSNDEMRNQFPEMWEKINRFVRRALTHAARNIRTPTTFPRRSLMFYNASNFDQIMSGGGSVNNDVYCAITGEDADVLGSGDMNKFDYRLDPKKLTMPLLILVGRYNRIAFPRWTIQYKRYAPQAQFVMFEKGDHFPFIEETFETVRVVREFLQRK